MKKLIHLFIFLMLGFALWACDQETTTTTVVTQPPTTANLTVTQPTTSALSEAQIYRLLIEAEELSGMQSWNGKLISESQDLGLPTSYRGVAITYTSRNPEIISNTGYVRLPEECWIESRTQDGITVKPNLNDNWPVVLDVALTYGNQQRTAKLMFIVAPAEGFTCNKYKG